MFDEAQHVVVIECEDLILEGNGTAIDIVGGDPVVPEHEADRLTARGFQGIAEDGIGHFSLQNGAAYNNISELKKALLKHEDALAKELTSSILAYALGRTVSFTDQEHIDTILATTKPDGYKMKDLVKEIAKSKLFKNK